MQLTIKSTEQNISVAVSLSDDRRGLANLLSIMDPSAVDVLEIHDMTESRLPKNIQRLSELQQLTLVRCHAVQNIPPELARCPKLRELSIIKCADFHDLRGIQKCPLLDTLRISGCDAFDQIPDDISSLTNLKALDLSYCEYISWIDLAVLPKSLRILDVHGCCRADFDPSLCRSLGIVSLQIQDTAKIHEIESDPVMPNLETQMRHIMTFRDGCGLDA